jgi:hypothetical protein
MDPDQYSAKMLDPNPDRICNTVSRYRTYQRRLSELNFCHLSVIKTLDPDR